MLLARVIGFLRSQFCSCFEVVKAVHISLLSWIDPGPENRNMAVWETWIAKALSFAGNFSVTLVTVQARRTFALQHTI
jgi:hypothetical protein